MPTRIRNWFIVISASTLLSQSAGAQASFVLSPNVQVDATGIFVSQLSTSNSQLPHLRIADSPSFGQQTVLTRFQIAELLTNAGFSFPSNFSGAEKIRVTRRSQQLNEADLKQALRETLQHQHVRDRGELEVRLSRPWQPVLIPDDPWTLKLIDLPNSGITPNFIVRFELRTSRDVVGPWQVPLQAKIWGDVWVARSNLRSGQRLAEADLVRERRDLLSLRQSPFQVPGGDADEALIHYELAETVSAGTALVARSVRLRPVIRRGQLIDAVMTDGIMLISLKVEALEDGAPGQLVRVRNVQSRKEIRGKVQDENSILVSM